MTKRRPFPPLDSRLFPVLFNPEFITRPTPPDLNPRPLPFRTPYGSPSSNRQIELHVDGTKPTSCLPFLDPLPHFFAVPSNPSALLLTIDVGGYLMSYLPLRLRRVYCGRASFMRSCCKDSGFVETFIVGSEQFLSLARGVA